MRGSLLLGPERRHPGQQPRHAARGGGIGRQGGELLLPQLDIAAGELGEIRRFGHGRSIRWRRRVLPGLGLSPRFIAAQHALYWPHG